MTLRDEVARELCGPGGPFEIVQENVGGEMLPVLANRPRSLREMLAGSVAHGDKEHLVHDERRITFAEHLDLVASTARALSEKYGIGKGDVVAILSANSPESGSAVEEIEVSYGGDPMEIGFNSRYLLDIAHQIEGDQAQFLLADAASPTIVRDPADTSALYVLMPMRV